MQRSLPLISLLAAFACSSLGQSITSVSPISTQQSQSIVIAGSGFGTQSPYTGDSAYIAFFDVTKPWEAGYAGPCPTALISTCQGASTINNAVTLVVQSWSDSSIVLGGFSGAWGSNNSTLDNGDEVQVYVWNAQSGSGPASITTFVTGWFTNVPGSLSQISVGADGSVWGINSSQQIFTYDYPSESWTYVPGSLTQIAVGWGGAVWGLNAQQQIYRWNTAQSEWTQIPGSLTQIAVGVDGDVWGLNAQSNIYHYDAQTGFFGQVPGTLSQIAVGSAGAVYGINGEGGIFWYSSRTRSFQYFLGTTGFEEISVGVDGDVWAVKDNAAYHYNVLYNRMDSTPGSIGQVKVGYGGAVFALDPSQNIFQWNAVSQGWVQIPGSLSSIAVGANGAVWGLNSLQQIYDLTGAQTRLFQNLSAVAGTLNQISVGSDGSVWGLSGSTVEYFNPEMQSFQAVSGAPPLSQISVGVRAMVWGVDTSGNIFQYDATSGTWNNIPGQLRFIQVGADNSVWGINSAGQIFTYDLTNSLWINIPGELQTLSVGADGAVWGINAQQQIYYLNSKKQSWVNVPGSLIQISVGNATNIWGINAQQHVYRYNTGMQSWQQIPGASLVEISVAYDGSVWGVNSAGTLYQWNSSTQSFTFVGNGVSTAFAGNAAAVWALNATSGAVFSWFGSNTGGGSSSTGPQPIVTLNTPAPGASQLSGYAYNVNPNTTSVVVYALTNEWYVQPLVDAPFTAIAADGSWATSTYPWSSLVVLLVNPAIYTPAATEITNPALDPGVLAWTEYPSGPVSLNFSGYTWGIKTTGDSPSDQFNPGPNFWSNDPSVVSVAADGLHLKMNQINGLWECGEVYLNQSLGYGTYTVHVSSRLDQLDQNTVAAPLFIYAASGQEFDNEYSGSGGLIASPNNAQFVVQPYTVPGNIVEYIQPPTAQFTSQMEWSADHIAFSAWSGWSSTPSETDVIYQWYYTGSYIPVPGQERVHINLWLWNGNAPLSGTGDEMVINSFTFQPALAGGSAAPKVRPRKAPNAAALNGGSRQ